MNIYVGNLAYAVTEEELREVFAEYGDVDSAKIISDKFSGRSKGFGFVEMPQDSQGEEAIAKLDGYSLKGRDMKVNKARPKPERTERKSW